MVLVLAHLVCSLPSFLPSFLPFFSGTQFKTQTTTALAANGAFRYLLGAVFPLFTIQMYEKLGIHWAGSVFGFLSLALLPIPFILFKFGPRLRQNSRFIPSEATEYN